MADDPLDILAWTMLGEAGGEGEQGMADVGHVILNRVNSGKYGGDIATVALAPKQFSTWNSGAGGNDPKGKYPRDSAAFQRARSLAEQVVAGTIPGPPGKPLDYHAPSVSPYWASSKDGNGSYTRNGHVLYPSVPVPPGEVPNAVGSLTDTVPPRPPVPVTPSIDMAQMRRISAPSRLVEDSFAGLPTRGNGTANLGDELGMYPIQGGKQQVPMFDAAYDERVGQMRMTREPVVAGTIGRSNAPPPVPAQMSPQLAGRRATDQALQAELNRRNPAQLPQLAPPMNAPRQVSASDLARGNSGISTIASIPTTGAIPTTSQILNGTGFRGGGPIEAPDRLMADLGPPPALYGGNVAGVGTRGIAPVPFPRPTFPTQFAAAPRTAPVPFSRPMGVGTALSTTPMPPMPIARPGIGGPFRIAPMPMPANMRPAPRQMAQPQQSGGSVPRGYVDGGNGKIIDPESGGVYFARHLN